MTSDGTTVGPSAGADTLTTNHFSFSSAQCTLANNRSYLRRKLDCRQMQRTCCMVFNLLRWRRQGMPLRLWLGSRYRPGSP